MPLARCRLIITGATRLKQVQNSLGQMVEFFEHPVKGDRGSVIAQINGRRAFTDFFDADDFYTGSEYLPELRPDGRMYFGHEPEDTEQTD